MLIVSPACTLRRSSLRCFLASAVVTTATLTSVLDQDYDRDRRGDAHGEATYPAALVARPPSPRRFTPPTARAARRPTARPGASPSRGVTYRRAHPRRADRARDQAARGGVQSPRRP